MKVYIAERDADGTVQAWVDEQGDYYQLPHLVHHSPTGFEYGYGGSGPADLARSIVGDFLATDDPDPKLCQAVKERFIASVPSDLRQLVIRGNDLQAVIELAADS